MRLRTLFLSLILPLSTFPLHAQNYTTDAPYIRMTTEGGWDAKDNNAVWMLTITPQSGAQNVWVDWNGNEQYDTGEESYAEIHPVTSKTITIYGDVVELDCPFNDLLSLDISHNEMLEVLFCQQNLLTALDLSKSHSLTTLDCGYNRIQSLDCSSLLNATEIYCDRNKVLETLILPATDKLTRVDCFVNRLKTLDVRQLPNLHYLYIDENEIEEIDLSNNTNLLGLTCSANKLTKLDLGKNMNLTILDCSRNHIPQLSLSPNTKLKTVACYSLGLSGESLDELIASLHTNSASESKKFVVFSNLSDENNICTTTQVQEAAERGWTAMEEIFNSEGIVIDRIPYAGTTGLTEIWAQPQLFIYPNPTTSVVHVRLPEALAGATATLSNVAGNTVLTLPSVERSFRIDLSNYPQGVYILRVGTAFAKVLRH